MDDCAVSHSGVRKFVSCKIGPRVKHKMIKISSNSHANVTSYSDQLHQHAKQEYWKESKKSFKSPTLYFAAKMQILKAF